jgi:uncharacterized protein YegP (UPF0339 family)
MSRKIAAFEYYKNEADEWQWTFVAKNGEPWVNAEGYTILKDCLRSIERFVQVIMSGDYVIRKRKKK